MNDRLDRPIPDVANFYVFSWQRIPEFYWHSKDPKFSAVFAKPPETWVKEVLEVLGKFKYGNRHLLHKLWCDTLTKHATVTSGIYEKYV